VNVKGLARVFGGTLPAKTWHDFMTRALEGKPTSDFPPPATPLALPPSAPGADNPSTAPPVVEQPDPYVPYIPPEPTYVYPPPGVPFYDPSVTSPPGNDRSGFYPTTVYVPPPPTQPSRSPLLPGLLG